MELEGAAFAREGPASDREENRSEAVGAAWVEVGASQRPEGALFAREETASLREGAAQRFVGHLPRSEETAFGLDEILLAREGAPFELHGGACALEGAASVTGTSVRSSEADGRPTLTSLEENATRTLRVPSTPSGRGVKKALEGTLRVRIGEQDPGKVFPVDGKRITANAVGPDRKDINPMSRSQTNHPKHAASESVGHADVLAEAKTLVAHVTSLVGPAAGLTQADYRRSTKLPKGGEGVIPTLVTLSEQAGINLTSHPTTTMVEQLNKAQSLVPLHKQLVMATKQVADALFLAESQSWESAGMHYKVLQRMAIKDGDLKKALAPVSQFFAARSRAVTAEEKAKRGGARKGSEKAEADLAAKREASNANAPANGESQAPPANAAAQTGAPPSPQATPAPTNGASH